MTRVSVFKKASRLTRKEAVKCIMMKYNGDSMVRDGQIITAPDFKVMQVFDRNYRTCLSRAVYMNTKNPHDENLLAIFRTIEQAENL